MAKRGIVLEWQIMPEDGTCFRPDSLVDLIEAADNDERTLSPMRALWWRNPIVAAAAGCLLFFLSVAGFMLWREAQAGFQQIRADIQETIELDAWSRQTGNNAAGIALANASVSNSWRDQLVRESQMQGGLFSGQDVTILDVALRGDQAMVTLSLAQPDAGAAGSYRTARFYRAVDTVWLRTPPAAQFWGPTQTLETDFFVFHFRHRDNDAVQATAARLDAIYTQLRHDLVLDNALRGKVRIDVVMELPASAYLQMDPERITVLSPLLRKIPEDVSGADILTHSIVNRLVRHSANEAHASAKMAIEWTLLLHGLQLWQTYTGSDSLPHWQAELSRWLYHEAPVLRRGEREPTLSDLALVCRADLIWASLLPLDPSPSTLCHDPDWRIRLHYTRPAPQKLWELVYLPESEYSGYGSTEIWMARVAATTMIEYLVQTYGRERIPLLIAGMRQYKTWDELSPAVVGIAAEELETGWLTYLDRLSSLSVNAR